MSGMIPRSIISKSMPVSPLACGARRDGLTGGIRADGFSGTAATTSAAEFRKKMNAKLTVGWPSSGTCLKSKKIVRPATSIAVRASARLSFTGPMTHANYEADFTESILRQLKRRIRKAIPIIV